MNLARSLLFTLLMPLAAAAQPAADNAAPVEQSYFHKYYSGKIGDKYPFKMDLKNLNGTLTGTYRYTGKASDLYLQGKIDANGAFTMEEQNDGKRTGVLTGQVSGKTISGSWQSTNGAKKLTFAADQTSEIIVGSKKEIMTKIVGRYTLEGIVGSGGANGMWDTWKRKGKWESNISGISMARRETSAIDLTKADIKLLDSIAIEVDSTLATRMMAGGKTLIAIPYQDTGMQYMMKEAHNGVDNDNVNQLSPNTVVFEEKLYLLAQDGVDFSTDISGNFTASTSNIVIVDYSLVDNKFNVSFVDDQCCGETTFIFTRKNGR